MDIKEKKDNLKPEKSGKPRMLEQDIAKGIAIILVMVMHTVTMKRGIYYFLGGLFGFIMPFYFFMAGYNHRPYRYTYKEIISKRIKQIVIPFFAYTISITFISGIYYAARQTISEKLAKYKVPAYFVIMDKFPLLGSGKIDAVTLKKEILSKLNRE